MSEPRNERPKDPIVEQLIILLNEVAILRAERAQYERTARLVQRIVWEMGAKRG